MERIAVLVRATDPISQAGVIAQLRASPDVQVIRRRRRGHRAGVA